MTGFPRLLAAILLFTASFSTQAQRIAGLPAGPSVAAIADLRLAQQLTPGSLASTNAQQQLVDALYAMLGDHPEVAQARASLESAGHDLETAKGARWPSLKLGTSSGSAPVGAGKQQERYSAINAEVRMKLLDGGAISAGIRSAESQASAQNSALYSTQQNVLLEALSALIELHRFDQKTRIAAESADIIDQLARVEERRAELGAVGRNDLRQAASRRASALSQQYALEAERSNAQARFVRYFNYRPGSWLPEPQTPRHWLPTDQDAALLAAEAQSSELQEASQQIERAKAEVERAKAERWPSVDAVVSHTRDTKGVLYADGTRYGVELNWNFGNGFELRERVLKAYTELQSQQAQEEAVRRTVHETTATAWGRWQAGQERQARLHEAVQEARAAFQGYRRLLEMGRGSLSQVLDAQLDMQRLMLDEADATYDQQVNALRLARTVGQLLPRDLPPRWLDQLFTPIGTQRAHHAQPATPQAATAISAPPIPLQLVHRLNPTSLSLPPMASAQPNDARRW